MESQELKISRNTSYNKSVCFIQLLELSSRRCCCEVPPLFSDSIPPPHNTESSKIWIIKVAIERIEQDTGSRAE